MECVNCRKLNATLTCEQCSEPVCKKCVEILPEGTFKLMPTIPEPLSHIRYCGGCYAEQVEPEIAQYEETLENAKRVFVFFKTRKKSLPITGKEKIREIVESCPDRDETILRLAFIAASKGYNAIIEVEALSKKIRNGAYQTSVWSGSGIPAQVDSSRIYDEDMQDAVYR